MEVLIFVVIVVIIVVVSSISTRKENNKNPSSSIETYEPREKVEECEIIEDQKNNQNVVINIQNNVYIHNDYSKKSKGHTRKVWHEKGYEVNYGETYAYMHYGNKIFKNSQVSKMLEALPSKRKYETHTYDDWQELGYQVMRGQKATCQRGSYFFTRSQVVRAG